MIALELPFSAAAVATGLVALGVAFYLERRIGTKVLRLFALLNLSLFGLAAGFFLRSLAGSLRWFAEGGPQAASAAALAGGLSWAASLAGAAGAAVLAAVLPGFVHSIPDRASPLWQLRIGVASGAAIAAFFVADLVAPGLDGLLLAGSMLLFANILLALVVAFVQARATGAARAREGRDRVVRRFVLMTLVFLPLFVADVFISQGERAPWMVAVDNTTLPLYFILTNLGFMLALGRSFDHPPLMEGEKLTDFAKANYGLTERETEVLEYVMDGYTAKDLAGVLSIAPKTAENHLYAVYQKTGVTNRIQLFQMFQNQRRD